MSQALCLCSVVVATLSISGGVPGAVPTFGEPILLQAGGKVISAGKSGHAGPAWHDVDGDGISDLVVGRMTDDTIDYYPNTSQAGLPKLGRGRALLINGDRLVVPGIY